jgi:predicted ATPase
MIVMRERTIMVETAKKGLSLGGFRIDPAFGGERIERLPFLSHGPVEVQLRSPIPFLISNRNLGKTTLLDAIAAPFDLAVGKATRKPKMTARRLRFPKQLQCNFAGLRQKRLFLRVIGSTR